MPTKSKYQAELEEFKKNLPDIIMKTAEDHGLDLCEEGLQDLFKRLDVPWTPPKQEANISLNFMMNLNFEENNYGYYDMTRKSEGLVNDLSKALNNFLTENFEDFIPYSICIDDVERQ